MGVRERRAREKRYLRQEIMDAASELFVKEGFENVSMRRIADRIEYSPTTIYLYFKDKAELLESICQETFAKLIQRLTKILEQSGDPIERLKRGLLAYVEFGLENPHHYRSTFMTPLPDEVDHEKYVKPEAAGIQAFDFLRRCVYDCIAAGKFKTKDAELARQAVWAAVHGITSLLITHRHFPAVGREQVIRGTIETMVRGLEAGKS